MRKMNGKQATSMKSLSGLYLSLRSLNPGGMRHLVNIKSRRCLGIFLVGIFLFELSWAQPQPLLKRQSAPKPVVSMAPLTNKDIEEMVKAGLATEIILAKIRSTPSQFDTSPAVLLKLKATNVPDSVILAMVQVPAGSKSTIESNASQSVVSSAVGKTQLPLTTFPTITIPDGTPLEIEVRETVSSEDLEEGSAVNFTVVQPLRVQGVTVVEKGAPAKARVMEVKKARHWGRAGQIVWAMQDVVCTDGSKMPLRFTKEAKGGGSSGKVAAAVVATAIVFWPAAPVWGLKKGKPAVIPAGKRFQVFVHGDYVTNTITRVAGNK